MILMMMIRPLSVNISLVVGNVNDCARFSSG